MLRIFLLILKLIWLVYGYGKESKHLNLLESDSEFWIEKAQNVLQSKINQKLNFNRAKNIILFLGDGMGFPTVAAARLMYQQREQTELSFEKFPHLGLSKTYCVDKQVADSACTSTSYLSGVKNNYGTIGVNAKVKRKDCQISEEHHTESIASWAQKAGKSTGFVTTTRVTHASPAGLYAHTSERDWESDADIVKSHCGLSGLQGFPDTAQQLIDSGVGRNFKVIFGGGRGNFRGQNMVDEEGKGGYRLDGKDLIREWINQKNLTGRARYIWNKNGLLSLDYKNLDYTLGLFEPSHCRFNLDIMNYNLKEEPTLADMTVAAIKLLQKDCKGFFLFVEGGRIDMAHHENQAWLALEETNEFSRAIEVARQMTDERETLILATADHSHAFTYSGYAERGSDIFGIADDSDVDGLPYPILSYGNGLGYYETFNGTKRVNISGENVDLKYPNQRYIATVPLASETHGGEDVGIYASGPYSHIFTGNYEQNNIPLLMAYAAKIGPYSASSSLSIALKLLTLSPIALILGYHIY
jgi:alkaline phosphatase